MILKKFKKFEINNCHYIYGGTSGDPTEGDDNQSGPSTPPPGIPSSPLKPKKQ